MIQSREYRGEGDYQLIRKLLIDSYAITGTMHNWGIDVLDWFRFNGKVEEEISNSRSWERQVRLWETDNDKLVGVVILDGEDMLPQIHPNYRQIEEEMFGWAEQLHQANRSTEAVSWPLSVYVYEYDEERQTLLRNRGYKKLAQDSYIRWRSFAKPIPKFVLPQGYSIRSLDGINQEDLEKRAAIANKAFEITKHTAQTIKMLQNAPTYRPDMDLVVVGPDGMFAGYCVLWFDESNLIGMFGPVGTHPDHRKLGLGKAMMCEGLERLARLRARMAYVDCDLDEAPNRLYESVGFREYDWLYHWQITF
jgi:ribosomal protein S18 acetylase RimI-like enzyme